MKTFSDYPTREAVAMWARVRMYLNPKAPPPRWSPHFQGPVWTLDGLLVTITVAPREGGHLWLQMAISRLKGTKPASYNQLERMRYLFLREESVVIQVLPPKDEFYTFGGPKPVLNLFERVTGPRLIPDLRIDGAL